MKQYFRRGVSAPDFAHAEAIRQALSDRAEDIFRLVWGEPVKASGKNWRARSSSARSMVMQGSKRGQWFDHKAGKGKDLLELVAIELCGLSSARDDFPRVLKEAATFCGIAYGAAMDLTALMARRAAQEAEASAQAAAKAQSDTRLIKALQARVLPLSGSPAAPYLASRGIDALPEGWCYLPPVPGIGVLHPDRPALVAWAIDAAGQVTGGQRILILEDGSKAPEDPRKPAFGSIGGSPARIPARAAGGPLCITEGPETAAAIAQATGCEVWAVFGVSGFAAVPAPLDRQVVLCPDCDAPGSPAAEAFARACEELARRGVDIWIAPAPEPDCSKRDLADTLQERGSDAVAKAVKGATRFIPQDGNGQFTRAGVVPAEPLRMKAPKSGVTPAQAIWGYKLAVLPNRRKATLREALAGVADPSQIGTVLAVAAALANHVPAQMGREDLIAFLYEYLPKGAIPVEWIEAVMIRIDWILDQRRMRALAPVTISKRAREGVEVTQVQALSALDHLDGITVLKAPMASGKTQKVARPWIEQAAKTEWKVDTEGRGHPVDGWPGVWAICHRVTLVEELAHRLKLKSYRASVSDPRKAAICLPSTTLAPFDRAGPYYLFIDEIQQVLRFLRSQDCCRTAKARTPDIVFNRLVDMVKHAKGILVADAGVDDSVLDFLQFCRPNELIRLVEMPEPADAGIEAIFLSGEKGAYGAAVDHAAASLHRGEKIWIATEGAEQAEKVGAFLRSVTASADILLKVLVITAKNKGQDEQAAFLRDPERESRRWDCVVASPVISSGISIEHREGKHFTRGYYLGTGQALTPADAAQQLRRVRYLRRFVIALGQNNATGGRSVEAILKGREDATRDEGYERKAGAFDHLIARFEAQEADAKADFAAGLWWQLEAAGWTLSREMIEGGDGAAALRKIGHDRAEARVRAIVAASHELEHVTQGQIDALRRAGESPDLVEAWEMSRVLGVPVLTPDDVAFCDGGGYARLDIFDDLAGISHSDMADQDPDAALVHRRLRKARAIHFCEIFGDHDPLSRDPWLTRVIASEIINRVLARADAYVASGAIPEKYAARFGRPEPARPRDPVKAVQAILARAGLRTVGIQARVSQIPPNCVTELAPICDIPLSQRCTRGTVERAYMVCPENLDAMQRRSAIRRTARINAAHPAHIEAVNQLFGKHESGSVLFHGVRMGLSVGRVWMRSGGR